VFDQSKKYDILFPKSTYNLQGFLEPFSSEFKWSLGKIHNGYFAGLDAKLYYSIIRTLHPELIIEIGGGHSTSFALSAMKKNKYGKILCIDPEPRRKLSRTIKHIKAKVESVNLNIFSNLNKNDILFIDSSHTREEALYHTKVILPSIKPGVLIHYHDFIYPYCAVFDEERVILDFYLKNQQNFEVLIGADYTMYYDSKLVNKIVPLSPLYDLRPGEIGGASLWAIRKKFF